MILQRITLIVIFLGAIIALLAQWNTTVGFVANDPRWWTWLGRTLMKTGSLPPELTNSLIWTGLGAFLTMAVTAMIFLRPGSRTLYGGADAKNSHGSAEWATWSDIRRAQLTKGKGVVVGGFKKRLLSGTTTLRHDGPDHVLAFAPTRSGKGVSLVLPTLLSWTHSVLVLDIKGENYALSAGWRKTIGQTVLRFDPAALTGSVRYNPLAEVRIGSDHEIADCQNIAAMIIDPDGKGLKDFWMQEGWAWLSAAILHVLYRIQRDDGRTATLADVHNFMCVGDGEELLGENGDKSFDRLLDDMSSFDHGSASVNAEIKRGAGGMRKKAPNERSGVHSSSKVQLALYSDPIVAANTSACDFRIADLMNADRPTSLYIVIPPSDIQRLRPLVRILMNQFLTRLTAEMSFDPAKKHYKHRLLLMLDEFTSIGKLEIFEKALAFMAGYGIKAYIFVQDLNQLLKEYGKDESISSNCNVQVAFAPNRIETAKILSDKIGKTTVVQAKRTRSHGGGRGANVSDSISEIGRPLLTPEECIGLPVLRKGMFGRAVPGEMLTFVRGTPPIKGVQKLYFQDKTLRSRSRLPAPGTQERQEKGKTDGRASAFPQAVSYADALEKVTAQGTTNHV